MKPTPDDIRTVLEFAMTLPRPVNPYTLAEERVWQRIVGSEPVTQAHVDAFERETGKKFDHNYLY